MRLKLKNSGYLLLLIWAILAGSCSGEKAYYDEITHNFVAAVMEGNSEKAVSYMSLETESGAAIDTAVVHNNMNHFRQNIASNYGDSLRTTFLKIETVRSNVPSVGAPTEKIHVYVQYEGKEMYGILDFEFDQKSRKIKSVDTVDIKVPVPSLHTFWTKAAICLVIPLIVLIVVGLVIWKLRSWPRVVALVGIFLLNFPAWLYRPVAGWDFRPFRIVLPVAYDIQWTGYLETQFSIALPLGTFLAIFLIWRYKK